MTFFRRGDRVQRYDTGDMATVTEDEKDGYLTVHYDGLPSGYDRPMLQVASKFKLKEDA